MSRRADRRPGRPLTRLPEGDPGRPVGVGGGGPRIALGVTGGIAAYKAAEIVRGLTRAGAEVHVLMTSHAREFITPLTLQTLSGQRVVTDSWDLGQGADIQHIALARGLDLLLVAPATADILAKFAHGIADDFLSTFYLAVTAPVAIAPAMNLWMWDHPATQANLKVLRERGVRVFDPGVGELACGEEGIGRMAEPEEIVPAALALLAGRTSGRASDRPAVKKKSRSRLRVAASS
ncbi:MAG TPA: flavoprotein [Candidatus Polarisedimenticolia bacterium]|nr:flavoprotein [Candidatus Polarisedimenticolia bacterium]